MKLWKLSQNANTSYETYDSAIVCAETREEARLMHPDGTCKNIDKDQKLYRYRSWVNSKDVRVRYVGEAKKRTRKGVILASYYEG